MTVAADEALALLEREGRCVRESGALGRSPTLIGLFDFLLEQSLIGRSPKEVEIAREVFRRSNDHASNDDASVRVYVHRLRRKLDDFYKDASGSRLHLPRGEYRLELTDAADETIAGEAVAPAISPIEERASPFRRTSADWREAPRLRLLLLLLAALVALNIGGWMLLARSWSADPAEEVLRTVFWRPLADSRRPIVLATGDYYIFGEATDGMEVTRLIREFSINSRDDLDQYIMAHPDVMGRYVDVNLHYLPTSIGDALGNLVPIVARGVSKPPRRPVVITASRLTPEILNSANIVYVGFFSGLEWLRDPLFQASSLAIGSNYDELIDRRTKRRFTSTAQEVADQHTPARDYGYIAALPGPAGNRILIVAGTRDAGVRQASEIATDARQLRALGQKLGGANAFEALFEVRTLGDLNIGSSLVFVRPILAGNVWRSERHPSPFPDEQPAEDRAGGGRPA